MTDLPDNTTYSFAVKTRDAAGNWSSMSNVASAKTKTTGGLTFECNGTSAHPVDPVASDPSLPRLTAFGPSPSSSVVSAQLNLAQPAWVDLAVYDVTGRMITSLSHSVQPPRGTIQWDLHSLSGAKVPAGLYFVRGQVDGESVSKTVIVSR